MKSFRYYLKTYPLSSLCILCIWILCLIPIPETPVSKISMIDKWTHMVMFGGLTALIWAEYGFRHSKMNKRKLLLYAFAAPMLLGGLVEIVQATCTTYRSGEWIDFAADAIGVVLGTIIGIPLAIALSKRKKDGATN